MKYKLIHIHLIIFLLVQTTLSSCKKNGCTDPTASNYNSKAKKDDNSCEYLTDSLSKLTFKFNHFFDNQIFSFDSIYNDDFNNNIQFSRASFYFGNLKFKTNDNEIIESSSKYFLINPNVENYVFGSISNSNISLIDFIIGIDSITNHLDPAIYQNDNDLSYQTPSTHWQMGINPNDWSYLFIVLEGRVDLNNNQTFDGGENFVFHIGGDQLSNAESNLSCNLIEETPLAHKIELNVNWANLIDNINLSIDNFTHTSDNLQLASSISENANNLISSYP